MAAAIFVFPVMGLVACLCIAVRPDLMARHVQRVQGAWSRANTLEKVGLVFMCVPVPGPFDEMVGFVFLGLGRVQRYVNSYRSRRYVRAQIAEDTCTEHGMFCCAECFNLTEM